MPRDAPYAPCRRPHSCAPSGPPGSLHITPVPQSLLPGGPPERGHTAISRVFWRKEHSGSSPHPAIPSVFTRTPVQRSPQKSEETGNMRVGSTRAQGTAGPDAGEGVLLTMSPGSHSCFPSESPEGNLDLPSNTRRSGPPQRTSKTAELVSAQVPKAREPGRGGQSLLLLGGAKLFYPNNLHQFDLAQCIFFRTLQAAKNSIWLNLPWITPVSQSPALSHSTPSIRAQFSAKRTEVSSNNSSKCSHSATQGV